MALNVKNQFITQVSFACDYFLIDFLVLVHYFCNLNLYNSHPKTHLVFYCLGLVYIFFKIEFKICVLKFKTIPEEVT